MLSPEQFDTSDPLPPFTISVKNLQIGGRDIGAVDIPVTYNPDWHPVFQLGEFCQASQAFSLDSFAAIQLAGSDENIELLVTRCQYRFDLGLEAFEMEAQLARLPLVLKSLPRAQSFRAVLLSPPRLIKKSILLRENEKCEFEIIPFQTRNCSPCLVSSNLALDTSDPIAPLSNFNTFITFMKGSYCGFGNLVASNKDGSTAFQFLGFTNNDPMKRQTNWFDIEIQNYLPDIFKCFSSASANETTRRALRQAISFYRASNTSRDVSIEMSIIAAYSALEAIVNYVLEFRAGWSQTLMIERSVAFSDKLRAATAYFGLSGDVLEHSPELAKLSKSRNNIDVFDLIAFIRNKLVHQDQKFQATGLVLHETWLVAQWLLEVLVFGVIGYYGKIMDRRIYNGWRGETMSIPLRR